MAASPPKAASESIPDIAGPAQVTTSLKRSAAATPYRFRDLLALDDFERHAKRRLPPMIYLYVAGAVETGAAFRNAQAAYRDYALTPRLLRDTSARSQQTELFGQT
jgi:L-lactate dehydrogenase (cytochrome)